MGNWTYRSEWVRCGKRGCRSCPHGPYWYRYRRAAGRLEKEYVGKKLPDPIDDVKPDPGCRLDDILSRQTRTVALALEILGFDRVPTSAELRTRFRQLSRLHHPDRGGEHKTYVRVVAAFEYLEDTCR